MAGRARLIGFAFLAGWIAAGCCHSPGPQSQSESANPLPIEAAAQPGSLVFPNEVSSGHRPRSVAFVCDASGTMATKMWSLKRELRKAILALEPDQQFSITILQFEAPAMLSTKLLPATAENKYRAEVFLLGVTTAMSTDPIPGIRMAFTQHPQLMYLLTDGDFPDNDQVQRAIEKSDIHGATEVHTIAFVDDDDHDFEFYGLLKRIADETGGTYKKVSVEARDERDPIYIAYVCDAGDSMAPKLTRLKLELTKAIDGLHPDQKFSVIFMQADRPLRFEMVEATPENKERAQDFLQKIEAHSPTDPIPALDEAFRQHPDLIYLIADRDFHDDARVVDEIHMHNGSYQAKINTIALVGPDPDDHDPNMISFLQQLASTYGGLFDAVNYTLRPAGERAMRP